MKKGIITTLLLFMTIVYLGYAGFALMDAETLDGTVGEGAKEVLKSYDSVEETKLTLKQYGKHASFDSFSRLVEGVGVSVWCGEISLKPRKVDLDNLNEVVKGGKSYVYLEYRGKKCYQDDVLGELSGLFNEEMNKYLTGLKEDNFEIVEDGGEYIAVMKEPISINDSYNFTYNISLESFDLASFIKLIEALEENSDECGNDLDCWEGKTYGGYTIDVSNDGNLFMFEATSNDNIKSFYGEKEVVLNFAIDYEGGLI